MKEFLNIIKKSSLFKNINSNEIEKLFHCLDVKLKNYNKGEFILTQDEKTSEISLILQGKVHIINEDYWGNRTIFKEIGKGKIFAESFATTKEPLSISVLSVEKTKIMLINFDKIIQVNSSLGSIREVLIKNLLDVISRNNISLTKKIEHISQRTTREKLLSYLSEQAKLNKSSIFSIPFNRQELADYLSVDRSAMSKELSKLMSEGILEYNKDKFKLFCKFQ